MLTLLLPGSWCFYYINNGAGTIHHGDMRLLIMSAPCIFTPFIKRGEVVGERQRKTERKRKEKRREWRWEVEINKERGMMKEKRGREGERGRWKGTISMCWTHDRCPWPFAEWLPCWQELTSVFKQDKTNGTSAPPAHWTSPFLFQLTAFPHVGMLIWLADIAGVKTS